MDEQNAGKKTVNARDEALKIIREMQRCEATAGALYKALARSVEGRAGEVLAQIAGEKSSAAQELAPYSGKSGRAPGLKVLGWRLLARVFGSSFAISRLEAGEAEARPYFLSLADIVPEAPQMCSKQEEHREQLRAILNHDGLRGIGAVASGLYGAILFLLGALASFTAVFSQASQAAAAGMCAAVAAVLGAAVTGYSSQKAASGPQRPVRSALVAGVLAAIAAAALALPYFSMSGAWTALGAAALAAAVFLALTAFFTAVVRQETYFTVFVEMILMTFGGSLLAMLAAWAVKVWFKLNA